MPMHPHRQSEVEGEAYGRDASATAVGVLCRKAKSGDTLTELIYGNGAIHKNTYVSSGISYG